MSGTRTNALAESIGRVFAGACGGVSMVHPCHACIAAIGQSVPGTGFAVSGSLLSFDQGMYAGSGDAAGTLADFDQLQFPFIDQPVDGGARNAQFGFGNGDAVQQGTARKGLGYRWGRGACHRHESILLDSRHTARLLGETNAVAGRMPLVRHPPKS